MGRRDTMRECSLRCVSQRWPTSKQAQSGRRQEQTLLGVVRVLGVLVASPVAAYSANITVNVTSNLFPMADTAFGLHTSDYDNEHGNPALLGRLIDSGVNTLRYPRVGPRCYEA